MSCPASTRSPPKSYRGVPAPAFSQSPVRGPYRMCCDPPAQNLQKSPDDVPAQFQTVRTRQPKPTAFLVRRRHFRDTPLPKMWFCNERYSPTRWRVFERVIQEIRRGLLHFLVIKTETGNGRIQVHIQPDTLALKRL